MKKLRKGFFKFVAVSLSAVLLLFATACDISGILNDVLDGDIDSALDKVIDGISPDSNPIKNEAKGESELRIHFLDVGQGDSILVELPDDTVMLIDSGDGLNTGENEISKYIVNYLTSLEITTIDYLVATHTDADHVGNMCEVLDNFEVEKAYVPKLEEKNFENMTKTYKYFYNKLQEETYTDENGESQNCEIVNSFISDVIESENEKNSFFIAFLAPTDEEYRNLNKTSPTGNDKNGVSPIMFLEYFGKRILFTGDTITAVEQKVVNNYNAGVYNILEGASGKPYGVYLESIDILKVAHHGGNTSSCEIFLTTINPTYSVISCGLNNKHGHPTQAVLDRLSEVNSTVYRTDLSGTVVATVAPGETDATITFNC